MHKLVIERNQWLRGLTPRKFDGNVLWSNELNAGCCLGHFCMKIAEVDKENIIEITVPSEVKEPIVDLTDENNTHTRLANKAMEINDLGCLSEQEREVKLTDLFSKYGYNLEFTGEGNPYDKHRE